MSRGAVDGRHQLRQPRLAEMIADVLRERILSGKLADGQSLPKQDDLLDEFRVSLPSIREALRILETEGLVTVRRGNVGGAVVHVPQAENAAYMFGLVLQSRKVPLTDVADALHHLEPICAGLCALRKDRATKVVPKLKAANKALKTALDKADADAITAADRHFHDELVAGCDNETLKIVAGALETVWTGHAEAWARRAQDMGTFPAVSELEAGLTAHNRLIEAIEKGDAPAASRIAARHLEQSQRYTLGQGNNVTVKATPLRHHG